MRKVLLCVLVAGVVAWGWPTAVLAQPECNPNAQPDDEGLGGCDCDVEGGDCAGYPDELGNCGCDWVEDFESYNLGLMPRVNGWQEWGWPDATLDLRGEITDEIPDHTSGAGKCMKVRDHLGPGTGTDQVHRFYGEGVYLHPNYPEGGTATDDGQGYDIDVNGYFVSRVWVYIPATHGGDSYFIMNSRYLDGAAGAVWNVQIEMNGTQGQVYDELYDDTIRADMIRDQWVELEVDIDVELDVCVVWYAGQYLTGYQWAADTNPAFYDDLLFLGTYDLFNAGGDTFYYDDCSVTAEVPPPCLPPSVECFPISTFMVDEDGDLKPETRCADYLWRLTNENRNDDEGPLDTFYLDIEAGKGGVTTTNDCRGGKSSITAITPPTGWSVVKCTTWNSGHALFKFTANSPGDAISVGQSVEGGLTVDPNLSQEYEALDTGTTIPGLGIVISAAQSCGNIAFETCATNDYSFGPSTGAAGQWASARRCYGYINIPATSTWAKVLLAMLLVGGGTLLVLRSRRPVTA